LAGTAGGSQRWRSAVLAGALTIRGTIALPELTLGSAAGKSRIAVGRELFVARRWP
jgi:hypothetical protein